MPVIFAGHGNPMHALQSDRFSEGWRNAVKNISTPRAILCISAHWESQGTFVTLSEKPPTIYDFFGFPEKLYKVRYPAPGDPDLAEKVHDLLNPAVVTGDRQRGLDHGCWSVLIHMFPEADIPVVQLSLDRSLSPQEHFELAGRLLPLRDEQVLILGSGNIVHNIGLAEFRNEGGFDWAVEAAGKMTDLILKRDFNALINFNKQDQSLRKAIPSPEHFLPMLYILALIRDEDHIVIFNDECELGSVAMTSIKVSNLLI